MNIKALNSYYVRGTPFNLKGSEVIEANGQSALCGPQITQQKGLKKEDEEILRTLK